MSRYCGDTNAVPILEAAQYWRQRSLEQDGSVFSEGIVWDTSALDDLVDHYVNKLDLGPGNYLDKLEKQLGPASVKAKQLAAEMQWVMLLCPSNITPGNKKEVVTRVWSWSGTSLDSTSPWFSNEVLAGIGSSGTAFNTNRWRELVFFIEVIRQFKQKPAAERTLLLNDGWAFAEFMGSIADSESRQLRHMLLFLLWPDLFERVFGGTDRRAIVEAFTGKSRTQVSQLSALQIDRDLSEIRRIQQERYATTELDFYIPPLNGEWKQGMIPKTITREHVLAAMAEIDVHGCPPEAQSITYDLIYAGRRYPPKYVLAIAGKYATGEELDRDSYSGGENSSAFAVLRKLDFEIERKDFIHELIKRFIAQADSSTDLATANYPETYCGLDVNVSFGKGTPSRIPWISFTGFGQTTTAGVYPVFLYYKANNVLILAYGISETNPPLVHWQGVEDAQSVESYLAEHSTTAPARYGSSMVAAVYSISAPLDYEKINSDLDQLISKYQEQLGPMVSEPAEQETGRVWMFQANPNFYHIDGALKKLSTILWSVRQHKDRIKKGDTAYIWRSGKTAGIVAIAKVLDNPGQFPRLPEEEDFVRGLKDSTLTVPCKIIRVLDKPLLREVIVNDPVLKTLPILNFSQGTNFAVSAEQAKTIDNLLSPGEQPGVLLQPEYSFADLVAETGFPSSRVEQWLSWLRRKKQIVLQGPPGTGKTFVAERLARHVISETDGVVDLVQFHPSYAYEDFMQGIRPEVIEDRLAFKLTPGRFLNFCATAMARGPESPCVLIIDELNRANLSRVFGELMYLLEYRDRDISLATGGARFQVPKNVYLIGTMNTADRSIALVDHALRRRFSFVFIGPEYEILAQRLERYQLPAASLVSTLKQVNDAINDKHYEIGISFFLVDGPHLRTTLRDIWMSEIEPYLEEYFYGQPDKVESFRWERLSKSSLAEWT